MKKLFFNYTLLLLLFLTCTGFNAAAQNIQVEAKLHQYTIRIGDQTKFFLSAHQPLKERVNFPKLSDTLTGKVQILSVKTDTVVDQNDRNQETVTATYTITCFDEGTYTIPALSFGTPAGILKSNEVTLQVQTVKVDTTKGIYDIKQPMKVSYTFLDWLRDNWLWVAIPLVVILLAIGVFIYLKKRPKKEVVIQVDKPLIPAHIIALNKLKALKEEKLWQQEQTKQYYIELSDVLREYLENRYAIKTHEKTTDEIFAGLRHISISDEYRNVLRQILVLADLVKFAKEKPLPAENEQSLESAMFFVLKTQQTTSKVNTEGGSADV